MAAARRLLGMAALGRLLGAGALLAGLGAACGAAAKDLVPLVRGLPWPHVSQLIGYDGRLWFANSRKFVNHNSADLYSFDPTSRTLRYERHLFSQDAGDPVVAGGLLYWPFEDSRWSPGRGEYALTDGARWRWGLLPELHAFHVHAMAAHQGALYAAPSAWRAHLQRSSDGGTTWRIAYAHPSPRQTVNRLVALASFGGALWAGLTAWHDPGSAKLLRITGAGTERLAGWSAGGSVPRLVAFGGWLYGRNVTESGASVWRTDGRQVQPVKALDGKAVVDLAAGPDALWAITGKLRGRRAVARRQRPGLAETSGVRRCAADRGGGPCRPGVCRCARTERRHAVGAAEQGAAASRAAQAGPSRAAQAGAAARPAAAVRALGGIAGPARSGAGRAGAVPPAARRDPAAGAA